MRQEQEAERSQDEDEAEAWAELEATEAERRPPSRADSMEDTQEQKEEKASDSADIHTSSALIDQRTESLNHNGDHEAGDGDVTTQQPGTPGE